jgi:hypothetical protein
VSVAASTERVAVKEALPALGMLAAFVFAWGLMQLLDRFCRALFGTAEGLVGWVPFAGKIAARSIHKIEQKVSNYIGTAERGIDGHIAASYHKLAAIVRSIPSQLVDDAGLIFGLAAALVVLPDVALVKYLIRVATHPLRAKDAVLGREQAHTKAQTKALNKSVAQGVYPRIKAVEHGQTAVLHPGITTAREQARAAENAALASYKYLTKHRTSLLTGVFTGAVAWALARVGGGWIRCSNWQKVGRAVCGMNRSRLDALLGLLAGVFLLANIRTIAEFAEAVTEEFGRDIARLVGVGEFPTGRFTIE